MGSRNLGCARLSHQGAIRRRNDSSVKTTFTMVKPCECEKISFSSCADRWPVSKSKRTPVRLRHRIEKASAAKQRKQRKAAKNVQKPPSIACHHANFCIEPRMEVKTEERPWHTKSISLQRQDPCRNRGEQKVESGTCTVIAGRC